MISIAVEVETMAIAVDLGPGPLATIWYNVL
jgi:hypothetical protein